MSTVYPDRPWAIPGEDPHMNAPCQVCGHADGHHGSGRTCWDCPDGDCQPRVLMRLGR